MNEDNTNATCFDENISLFRNTSTMMNTNMRKYVIINIKNKNVGIQNASENASENARKVKTQGNIQNTSKTSHTEIRP